MDWSFAIFDTAIGSCALVWTDRGVAGLHLPEPREDDTRARVRRRYPGAREAAAEGHARDAIDGVVSLLRGNPVDLSFIQLDLAGQPPFHRRVYEAARAIPPGQTASYGEIAARIGSPGAARDVGQALARNPIAVIVPCHRVLAAGGKLGGFSAPGGTHTKRRLLIIEGAAAVEPSLFHDQSEFPL